MTPKQLTDYLKNLLKNQKLTGHFTELEIALRQQQAKDLDKARIDRALGHLTTLSLNTAEIKTLSESSDRLSTLFLQRLDQLKAEVINEYQSEWLGSLEQEKAEKGLQIENLKNSVSELDNLIATKRGR